MVKFGIWPSLPRRLLTTAPGSVIALLMGVEPGWPGFTDWQDPRGREQRRERSQDRKWTLGELRANLAWLLYNAVKIITPMPIFSRKYMKRVNSK